MTDEPSSLDLDPRCGLDGCDGRHCHICGTCQGMRVEQYVPTASGPGCDVTTCTTCLLLPADPHVVPPLVDEILARKGMKR